MPPQKNNVSTDEITEIIKYLRYSEQKTAGLSAEDDASEEDDTDTEETKRKENKQETIRLT